MSGGVDSSVAALLLKQRGVDIVGAYMKNWINEDNVIGNCPWMQDIEDARAVCDHLGIEFRVVNLMQEYRERIVQYLLDGYARGLTPNPDVMCNREIKFGIFRQWAKDHGFDAVATGHYARRVEVRPETGDRESETTGFAPAVETFLNSAATAEIRSGRVGLNYPVSGFRSPVSSPLRTRIPPSSGPETVARATYALLEGFDKNKDQSYFLALLSQEQLRDARFPVGDLPKPELRRIARAAGLPTADKKDSQGICFIGEVKMADFLRAYVPDAPGPIVRAADGRELGQHRGLHFYTLGQRKGIGIPSNTDDMAYVVVGKRAGDRALLVAFDQPDAPGLFQSEVRVHSLSWVGAAIETQCDLEARVRYRDPRVPIQFSPDSGGMAHIRFAAPQRGLASGQILALYRGEQLLGGGIYV